MGGTPAQPVTIDGVAYASLRAAARHFGINHMTLKTRLERGLSTEQLGSTEPVRTYKRKTHCKRGHLLELTGRIFDIKGRIVRQCRACHRERANEAYHQAHPNARYYSQT